MGGVVVQPPGEYLTQLRIELIWDLLNYKIFKTPFYIFSNFLFKQSHCISNLSSRVSGLNNIQRVLEVW